MRPSVMVGRKGRGSLRCWLMAKASSIFCLKARSSSSPCCMETEMRRGQVGSGQASMPAVEMVKGAKRRVTVSIMRQISGISLSSCIPMYLMGK